MDYEEFGNITANLTFFEDMIFINEEFLAEDIIFTIITLITICIDFCIIFVIFRRPKMRTVPNIILANIVIADLCYMVCSLNDFKVLSVYTYFTVYIHFACFLIVTELLLQSSLLTFTLLLAIDWYFSVCFERASEKLRQYYKYIIASIWIATLLMCSITTGICIFHSFPEFVEYYLIIFGYPSALLFVTAAQVYRIVQKLKGRTLESSCLMLNLATVCVYSRFLAYLQYFLLVFVDEYYHTFAIIGARLMIFNAILNFIVLLRQNKHFRAGFLQIFKRSSVQDQPDFVFHNPVSKLNVENVVLSSDKDEEVSQDRYARL